MPDRRDRHRAAHSIEWLLNAAALNHSSRARPPTRKPHSPNLSTSPNLAPCPTQDFLLRHLPLPRYTPFCQLQLPRATLLRLLPSPFITERQLPTFPNPPHPLLRRTSSLALKSHDGRAPPSYAIRLLKACTLLDSLLWRKCLTAPLPITHFASDYAIIRLLTSHGSSGHAPALVMLACKSVPTLLCTISNIIDVSFMYVYNGNLWNLWYLPNLFLPETLQGSPTTCKECIHLHYRKSRPRNPDNDPDDPPQES